MIKSMVYGGMDGIITTFAIVCAASGAGKDNTTIVTMVSVGSDLSRASFGPHFLSVAPVVQCHARGPSRECATPASFQPPPLNRPVLLRAPYLRMCQGVANLIADGISMGMGDYMSDRAEQDYAALEMSKKEALVKVSAADQQVELVKLYTEEKGVDKADAEAIVQRMAKYPSLFAEQLMKDVSGMQPPEDDSHWGSVVKGLITFVSFLFFGVVPLLLFVLEGQFKRAFGFWPDSPLTIVVVASGITMFILGAIAGIVTEQNAFRSGAFLAAQGLLTAYSAYAIGESLENWQTMGAVFKGGGEL